jgi:hypothetical protein
MKSSTRSASVETSNKNLISQITLGRKCRWNCSGTAAVKKQRVGNGIVAAKILVDCGRIDKQVRIKEKLREKFCQ